MHSDPEQNALRDILRQIDPAQNFAQGQDRDAFSADIMRVYAVTRCLEVISEASRRLSKGLRAQHPGIAWREMAGAVHPLRDAAIALRAVSSRLPRWARQPSRAIPRGMHIELFAPVPLQTRPRHP